MKRQTISLSPRGWGLRGTFSGDGKTSLRGGYGIAYERNFGNVTFNVIENPPNYETATLTSSATSPLSISTNNYGPLSGTVGTLTLPQAEARYVDQDIKTAYAHMWSADAFDCTARLNPNYSTIYRRSNGSYSLYNGVNFRATMQNFAHAGITLTANYTWSHAIDNLSSTFSEANSLLTPNSGFDLVGLALDPFKSGNLDIDHYSSPLYGFSDLGPFPSDMMGRNAFTGPGLWNLDMGLYKTFRLTERVKLQLRGEAYNIFNHANLYLIGSQADVSSTNVITTCRGCSGTTTDRRNLQLAAKIIF
jgi:hypothetical protein